MKRKIESLWIIVITFVIFLGVMDTRAVDAAEQDQQVKTIKIGYTDTIGYYCDDEQGDFGGVGCDYEEIMAQYANWNIEYVKGTWSELNQMLEDGSIDLLGFMIKTEEREEKFGFSSIPFGTSQSCFVGLETNELISYEDYAAMDNMTIGYQRGNANIDNMLIWCEHKSIHLNLREYRTTEEALNAVRNQEIDLALATNYNTLDGLKIMQRLLPENTYYAVKRGNTELLQQLNMVMENIALYYPDLSSDLYDRYFDKNNASKVAFTSGEMEYLSTHPIVYVYQGARSEPYESYDKNSDAYIGIVPDILTDISAATGITVEYIQSTDRWGYLSAQSGTNKMTTFTNDFDWAEQKQVTLTQSFMDSQVSIITKEPNATIHTVAAVDNQYICEEVKKHYPDYKMIYFDTAKECFEAVLAGNCDATFSNSVEADYFFNMGRFSVLHEEISDEISQNVCFGITKDSNPSLTGIISKALLSISKEKCDTIVKENINRSRNTGVLDLLYTNPREMAIVIITMMVLLIISLVFGYKFRRAYQMIRDINDKDSVTKVHSRTFYDNELKKHLVKQNNVGCLYLDLNGLHELNNEKGHQQGDILLQETGDVLSELFQWKNVYRMGGDEFLVIVSRLEKDAFERIIHKMEMKFQEVNISTSYGYVYYNSISNAVEMQQAVNEADEQMLENKRKYYEKNDRRKR